MIHGIRCTTVERALYYEMQRIGEVREMAVAVGLACAAQTDLGAADAAVRLDSALVPRRPAGQGGHRDVGRGLPLA